MALTPERPPQMALFPLSEPLSRSYGHTPTKAEICLRFNFPNSGNCVRSTACVTGPIPFTLSSNFRLRVSSSDSLSLALISRSSALISALTDTAQKCSPSGFISLDTGHAAASGKTHRVYASVSNKTYKDTGRANPCIRSGLATVAARRPHNGRNLNTAYVLN